MMAKEERNGLWGPRRWRAEGRWKMTWKNIKNGVDRE